jgi:outer membrane protein assembly factor BamE (lipoprotein component of BamABCDE complex)
MKKIIPVILVCYLLAGCATTGLWLNRHGVLNYESARAKIIKGKTTRMEIAEFFGEPGSTVIDEDGNEEWVYTSITKATYYREDLGKTAVVLLSTAAGGVVGAVLGQDIGSTAGGILVGGIAGSMIGSAAAPGGYTKERFQKNVTVKIWFDGNGLVKTFKIISKAS